MSHLLSSSLFEKDETQFERIHDTAKAFASNYWGSSIIGENIFKILPIYANKNDIPLEVLSYPFHDDELWAFSLMKKGTIFVCINSSLPMCKQIFAAAHELFHIYKYAENSDTAENIATLLDSRTADEGTHNKEDLEANAFAALLLMPKALLQEQIDLFQIDSDNPTEDDILALMDTFGVPFKAVVLRLYECHILSKTKAENLLSVSSESVEQRSRLTGKARRWIIPNRGVVSFGSLLENFEYNKSHDFLTTAREKEDSEYLNQLIDTFDIK